MPATSIFARSTKLEQGHPIPSNDGPWGKRPGAWLEGRESEMDLANEKNGKMGMTREQLLRHLSAKLLSLPSKHPIRVALDGIDAAGKTMLADELAPLIEAQGRPVIRASIDGFHQPRSVRYQRGPVSPEGYYEDSFDYASLNAVLLHPLGPQGNGHYQR